jgi:hypothetical protein
VIDQVQSSITAMIILCQSRADALLQEIASPYSNVSLLVSKQNELTEINTLKSSLTTVLNQLTGV